MAIKRICDACGEYAMKSYNFGITDCDETGEMGDETPLDLIFELCPKCLEAVVAEPLAAVTKRIKLRTTVRPPIVYENEYAENQEKDQSNDAS